MLVHMPELGELSGKQAASLAGLAPISRQSGKWQGKERIQGGRACLRNAIYIPAVVATRFNPEMKAKYHQLIRSGKCKKLAITAVMRKLIVMANVLLRDGRNWTEVRLDQYGYSLIAVQSTAGQRDSSCRQLALKPRLHIIRQHCRSLL
jgi:transposase